MLWLYLLKVKSLDCKEPLILPVFDCSEYRRRRMALYGTHDIFRADNAQGSAIRRQSAGEAVQDAILWLKDGNSVGVSINRHRLVIFISLWNLSSSIIFPEASRKYCLCIPLNLDVSILMFLLLFKAVHYCLYATSQECSLHLILVVTYLIICYLRLPYFSVSMFFNKS